MQKISLVLMLLLLNIPLLKAQHCPFDNTGILVVRLVDAETGEKISGYVPVLGMRNVQTQQEGKNGQNPSDLYPFTKNQETFVPNPATTDENWLSDDYRFEKVRYSFAENDFIRPISMDLADYELIIRVKNESGEWMNIERIVESNEIIDLHKNIGGNWPDIYDLGETPPLSTPFTGLIIIEI